jgi:phospholipid/cholesterol/gamma-HCH transport system permease protein
MGDLMTMNQHFLVILSLPRLFRQTVQRAFYWPWRWPQIFAAVAQAGMGSLPLVVVSTTVAGVVTTNIIAWHMDMIIHTVDMVPGFTGAFILRELGVAIPAFLMVSKVGAAITAEVGSMKVTEQIDALRLLGIDPITYLVFPRFLACIFSCLCLTIIAIVVTMTFALLIAVNKFHFGTMEYMNAVRHFVGTKDLVCAATKAIAYGAVIPIISCAYGFGCQGGAEGVGSASTNSVVTSTIAVIILDFILTFAFSALL